MVATRQAELRLRDLSAEILINGTDVARAVHSIVLRGQAGSPPTLELNLLMPVVEVDGDVRVEIPGATHAALVELGWTPPAGDA